MNPLGYIFLGFGLFVICVVFIPAANPAEWPPWKDGMLALAGCTSLTIGIAFLRERE